MDQPKDTKREPSFEDLSLNKQVLNALKDMEIYTPTDIQQTAIPLIMAGHDIFGIAPTGTGKTAAYLVPLIMKLRYAQGHNTRAVVFAPTRELVTQIAETARKLSKYTDLRIVELYGGLGAKTQIESIEMGVDIVVSTPGRFMEIYLKGYMAVKQIKTMILDEADKMMDMGFMPQIRKILEVIPVKRQNLLFSATLPPKVEVLSEEFLEFPQKVEVQPQATPAKTVEQWVYLTPNLKTKINLLYHLLKHAGGMDRVMIFTKTKTSADAVFNFLERKKLGEIRVIHANKGQNTRLNTIEAFKAGELRILVATDVMARGIDVLDVSHVVNFEVPLIYEDYVHRIGRTGRAFKTGTSITFVNPAEEYHFKKIEQLIRQNVPKAAPPKEVEIPPTPMEEKQAMLREIDAQRKKENPHFKGAFHEKQARRKKSSPGKRKKP